MTRSARTALAAAAIAGDTVTIAGAQTDAAWRDVKTVLELAGGTYLPGKSVWRFPEDATAVVARLLDTGQVVHERHTEGYVPTPTALAERLCGPDFADLGTLAAGSLVLEPSAGDGQIVRAMLATNPDLDVFALEPDEVRFAQLMRSCGNGPAGKRETLEDHAARVKRRYDAIVMNPPFNITGTQGLWVQHIMLAYKLLKPGARLVALVPAFATKRGPKYAELRELVRFRGGSTELPRTDFPDCGVKVAVLWLDAPAIDKPSTLPHYVARTYTGDEVPAIVGAPAMNTYAARLQPVQSWFSPWHQAHRILRCYGTCAACPRTVWGFDDGENDPRGILDLHSAGNMLRAQEYGKVGPDVLMCWPCGGDGDSYRRGLALAEELWTDPQAEPLEAVEASEFDVVQLAFDLLGV